MMVIMQGTFWGHETGTEMEAQRNFLNVYNKALFNDIPLLGIFSPPLYCKLFSVKQHEPKYVAFLWLPSI